jgi:lysyl-tRNA synthetase, class II
MVGTMGVFEALIVQPGKLPLLLLLAGMVVTFLTTRVSVRMIRAGVRWWPGNVSSGGLHVHHVVFGTVLMGTTGVAEFGIGPVSPWHELLAFGFGAGLALVLDEFALILHLEDVYWAESGRTSVTTTMLSITIVAMLLLGFSPLDLQAGGEQTGGLWVALAASAVDACLVAITLLKGKYLLGLLGIVVTPLLFVGAIRLARPASPWARWRYMRHPRKLAAARRRQERLDQVWARRWHQVMDLVAGAPTRPG